MEGPISFRGYKEQESNLILPEHDDDDDDVYTNAFQRSYINNSVYNVNYFYLAFTSSGVIFLKHRY
jgi:hypothetical protein